MQHPGFDPDATQVLDLEPPAAWPAVPSGAAPPAHLAGVPLAAAPPTGANRGLKVATAVAAVVVLVLAGAVGVVATRPAASSAQAAGRPTSTAGTELGDVTGALGGLAHAGGPSTTVPATTAASPVTTAPTPTAPPTTAAPTTTTTTPTPKAPVVTVAAPATVDCTAGGTPYINLSWNAPGATKVDLAIDGPGLYKSYPGAAGSDAVPFACDGPHTYTFTAHGAAADGTRVVKITSTKAPTPPITAPGGMGAPPKP